MRWLAPIAWLFCVAACSTEAPPIPKPTPQPAATPAPSPKKPSGLLDELGRLAEAPERISSFHAPKGLKLESQSDGLLAYTIRVPLRPLVEFYLHRGYHVIKRPIGYDVVHTERSRGDSESGRESLQILQWARSLYALRFHAPEPRNQIPEINARVLRNRRDLTAEQHRALEQWLRIEEAKAEPTAKPLAVRKKVKSFNPNHSREAGAARVDKSVEKWLKAQPGKVFYD